MHDSEHEEGQLVLAEPPHSGLDLADPLGHGLGQLGTQFRGDDLVPGFLDFTKYFFITLQRTTTNLESKYKAFKPGDTPSFFQ